MLIVEVWLKSDSFQNRMLRFLKVCFEIKFNWLNDKSMNQRNQGYIGYNKWTKSKFNKLVQNWITMSVEICVIIFRFDPLESSIFYQV